MAFSAVARKGINLAGRGSRLSDAAIRMKRRGSYDVPFPRQISKAHLMRNTAVASGLVGGGYYAGRRSTARNGLTTQNRGIYNY